MTTPNVLLVVADQLRWDWLSCVGTVGPDTPVIDSLAERGIRFTSCTTTSAMCAPARISLASGLLPHRVGALDNHAYLPSRVGTWYQRLRDADHRVGIVGKLDLAKPQRHNGLRGDRPSVFRWGFTHPVEAEGKFHAGTSATPIGPYTAHLAERGLLDRFHEDYLDRMADLYVTRGGEGLTRNSVLPEELFADAWIGDAACKWLEEVPNDGHPWFLQVGFVGPHDPYDPPATWAERYRHRQVAPAVPTNPKAPRRVQALRFHVDDADIEVARRQYTASLAVIDEQIGRLLSVLDATDAAPNTVVMFTADHGDLLGDHGLFQKHFAYEAAMRVPFIVAGPSVVSGGVSDALVELSDVGETILDLVGVSPTPDVDARSFAPVVADPMITHRTNTVCLEAPYNAIRTSTHKLILTHSDGVELYDLAEDPTESHNIAAEHPQTVRAMQKQLAGRLNEGQWAR